MFLCIQHIRENFDSKERVMIIQTENLKTNNISVIIKHSQAPVESPKLFNTPAKDYCDEKKYIFYPDGKIQKIESFDEEKRLSKEKLFSKEGKIEIIRQYEYLKNPEYGRGCTIRIGENNILTGEKTIKEITPEGVLVLLSQIDKNTGYAWSKTYDDNGNLKILSDNKNSGDMERENSVIRTDKPCENSDNKREIIDKTGKVYKQILFNGKYITIYEKTHTKNGTIENFYTTTGRLENKILTDGKRKRTVHFTEFGDIAYIKELSPEHKKISIKKNGRMVNITDISHKKINENEYVSSVNGNIYNIKFSHNSAVIFDVTSGKNYKINLDKLLQNIKQEDKEEYINILKMQNGEILKDLSIEADVICSTEGNFFNGLYDSSLDTIYIEKDASVLAHELGHALDYNLATNTSSVSRNQNFTDTYLDELYKYIEKGGTTIDFNNGNQSGSGHYASTDEKEMFAEIYSLLINGTCSSDDCIIQYFPETLSLAKKHIEKIRKMPVYERH